MKKQEIISVLSELQKITGFRISLHDADYTEIAAYPEDKRQLCRLIHQIPGEYEMCLGCDKAACRKALATKTTYTYTCRHGLTEAVSPLYNFGTLTGFLMMGQVYKEGQPRPPMSREIRQNEALAAKIREASRAIPTVKPDMIRSYTTIMTICAQYLTLSNAISQNKPTVAQMAKKYIFENYTTKFGIKDICTGIGCSKSTLITAFKREFGITINDYITNLRLTEAVRMLRAGEKSIGEIAAATGFSDQSYFSKVFSARYGCSPSEYRADAEEEI